MRNINIYVFFTVSNNWSENVHKLAPPCLRIGTDFWLSFLLITPLLFEDFTGKYYIFKHINGVYRCVKEGRNYLNSFGEIGKNVNLCPKTGTKTLATMAVSLRSSWRPVLLQCVLQTLIITGLLGLLVVFTWNPAQVKPNFQKR